MSGSVVRKRYRAPHTQSLAVSKGRNVMGDSKNEGELRFDGWWDPRIQKNKAIFSMADLEKVRNEFGTIIDSDCPEETVHSFLGSHGYLLDAFRSRWRAISDFSAVLSKFPITADRIPDFTLIDRHESCPDFDAVTFVEIKRPNSRIFVDRGRLSRHLNDALIEAIDCFRLFEEVLDDYWRRVSKRLNRAPPRQLSTLEE